MKVSLPVAPLSTVNFEVRSQNRRNTYGRKTNEKDRIVSDAVFLI